MDEQGQGQTSSMQGRINEGVNEYLMGKIDNEWWN